MTEATKATREALHLVPDNVASYENLANFLLALQRFEEAKQMIQQAQGRQLDDYVQHLQLYALGFLAGDLSAMTREASWFEKQPNFENLGLSLQADTEGYAGHLQNARELTKRAVDFCYTGRQQGDWGDILAIAAQREAVYGYAGKHGRQPLRLSGLSPTSQGVEVEAALAFAMAGDTARAESLAKT